MSDRSKELDRLLSSGGNVPEELASSVETARRLEESFTAPIPHAGRERAMFVQGVVGTKRRSPVGRMLAPALGAAALAGILGFLAGSSLPGDALYPVREVLGSVGLSHTVRDDINDHIQRGSQFLDEAEAAFDTEQLAQARSLAEKALGEASAASSLLAKLDNADELRAEVTDISDDARDLLEDILEAESEATDVDNSGPGSTNDGSKSGPGRGDDGGSDDSSGSGSGSDDDGSGDNSGSGSDDGGSDDGGTDDGGSDDNSGSGSGSDDSSGSGSGDRDGDLAEDEADDRADTQEDAAEDAADAAEDAADEADDSGGGSGSD